MMKNNVKMYHKILNRFSIFLFLLLIKNLMGYQMDF